MKNDNVKLNNFNVVNILILATLFSLPFYFIKFKYGWASLNLVEILIITLLLAWVFNREKKYLILYTKYFIPVLLIFSGLFLSVVINKNYYVGFGAVKGWFLLPIIFAVILYDNLKKNEKLLGKVFVTLFASGAFVAMEGVYYWFSGLLTYDGRLRIFFDSPNQLAMFLVPAFLIGILRFDLEEFPRFHRGKEKVEPWKIGALSLGLLLVSFNLYLTKSYGAWLAIGLALIIIFWLKYREIWPKKYFAIIIIIFIILIASAGFPKFENTKKLGDRSSLASRVMIWKSAGLMIEKNPLFGIGPGNFQDKYLEYQKYFPPYLEWSAPQPHNLYLAFWLESGLSGLVGFIWLLLLFFRDNKKAIENNRLYGTLCLAIILYFLLHGLIDTTYWRNDMAVVFWSVVAINCHLAKSFVRLNQRMSPPQI